MIEYSHLILLFLAIGVIAFLYSCVGHAGASGYIAVMTLFGLVTTTIRPTALVKHSPCDHRVFSVLASRTFLMEIILAVRAPFSSGCLLRRLSPVTCSNFENHYRSRPALLCRPIVFSSRRSPGGYSTTFARRARGWFRHRISFRSDRHRGRNFSHTPSTSF